MGSRGNPRAPKPGSTSVRRTGAVAVSRLPRRTRRRGPRRQANQGGARRALALDPAMHDAEFGIGMNRYYAGVAPAIFRFLRFFLLLPGGDRAGGLAQLERASREGVLVRGEAQFQIHVLYLSIQEKKWPQALAIHSRAASALFAQSAVPADRSGDPRCLLPRSGGEPQGIRATARARAIAFGLSRRRRRTRRAPQHRAAISRAQVAETPTAVAQAYRSDRDMPTRLMKM